MIDQDEQVLFLKYVKNEWYNYFNASEYGYANFFQCFFNADEHKQDSFIEYIKSLMAEDNQ